MYMSLSPTRTIDPKNSPAIVSEQKEVERDERDQISFCATASNPGSPTLLPAPYSPGPFGRLASFSKTPQLRWRKRQIPRWKSPLLMILFFIIGLAMSLGHCIFYPELSGKLVGDSSDQEENIRFGTAFSFLAQICLAASVWTSYTQWLWRTVKKTKAGMTVACLNASFSVDTSVLSFLNLEMLRKMPIGSAMALFAWGLLLPPFFTPATLFIYPSTNAVEDFRPMPYPAIANSTAGHTFAYSPPIRRGTIQHSDDLGRLLTGPRTILNLISTATASLGEILPVISAYNTSVSSVQFFAPIIKCKDANMTEQVIIDRFRQEDMAAEPGAIIQTDSAYYAFVPTYNSSGDMIPVTKRRQQSPVNATNLLWMTFLRPAILYNGTRVKERHYQTCHLCNATYDLTVRKDHGFQNITGSYKTNEIVHFPQDKAEDTSDMTQHAYAAFMWVIVDQLIGKFAWGQESNNSNSSQFGIIDSQLQRTSLLGTLDLDAFFEFDEDHGLYATVETGLSEQRLQDKALARNRTLAVLIEELSFNTTVSLMHNPLLTDDKNITVVHTDDVNRYGYKPFGLFIPYGLANFFTFVTVLIGMYSYMYDDVMPDKKFQDIVSAAEDPEIIQVVKSRKRSMTAVLVGDKIVLRAGPSLGEKKGHGFKMVRIWRGGKGRSKKRERENSVERKIEEV